TSLTALLLIAVAVGMVFLRRPDSNLVYPLVAVCALIAIAPGTSYSYYTSLFLVPAAFVLRDPRAGRAVGNKEPWWGILDGDSADPSRGQRAGRWLLVLGLALVLTPLAIPVSSVPFLDRHMPPVYNVGILQYLWGPIMLGLFALTVTLALVPWRRSG